MSPTAPPVPTSRRYRRPALRRVIGLAGVAGLAGAMGVAACRPIREDNRPVSGLTLTGVDTARPGQTLLFTGAALASDGLAQAEVGLRWAPRPWVWTEALTRSTAGLIVPAPIAGELIRDGRVELTVPEGLRPGTYVAFSRVVDRLGTASDTNRTNLFLDSPRERPLPVTSLSSPVPQAAFGFFRAGDSITVTGRVARAPLPARVVVRFCPVGTGGAADCPPSGLTVLTDTAGAFRARVEVPLLAPPGTRLRLRVLSVNDEGEGLGVQPGIEIIGT